MTRLLLALALGAVIGCTGIQPVGPFANKGVKAPAGKAGTGKDKDKDKDDAPGPVTVPAVKPTPPLNTVGPEDVSPDNPYVALQKVQQELEADRQRIGPPPKTAEISRYKNNVKVE